MENLHQLGKLKKGATGGVRPNETEMREVQLSAALTYALHGGAWGIKGDDDSYTHHTIGPGILRALRSPELRALVQDAGVTTRLLAPADNPRVSAEPLIL